MKLYIGQQMVNPVLGAVRLEKSRDTASAILTATVWTAAADTYFQKLTVAVGSVVRLLDDDGTERFLGSVHAVERTPERVDLTAFDRGVFLSRNEVYGVFAGTGADICRQIASRLGFPVGELDADGGYQVLTVPGGESAFQLLRQAAGKGREVTVEGNALTVRRTRSVTFLLRTEHILEISSSADIRSMVDRCVVVDRKGRALATAVNGAEEAAYGTFQRVLSKSGSDTAAQAQNGLEDRCMAAEVRLLGNLGYRCGAYVRGSQPQWGLEGLYVITAVAHRWEKGQFTSELTLEGCA